MQGIFLIIRCINDNFLVLLGSPYWRNYTVSENKFRSMWEDNNTSNGSILLIYSKNESLVNLHKYFLKISKINRTFIDISIIER